jgi:transposase
VGEARPPGLGVAQGLRLLMTTTNHQRGRPPKLTDHQIQDARRRYAQGEPFTKLAADLGVSRSTMHKAVQGAKAVPTVRRGSPSNKKLPDTATLLRLVEEGKSQAEIGRMYHASRESVRAAVLRCKADLRQLGINSKTRTGRSQEGETVR